MQVLRCIFPDGWGKRNVTVFTLNADGSNLTYTPGHPSPEHPVWGQRGGHPNWHPNGDYLIRNLNVDGVERLCEVKYDGTQLRVLSAKVKGGGHATIEPSGRYVITDDFPYEGVQKVSIRLIDLSAEEEEVLCKLPTVPIYDSSVPTQVQDPSKHPALRLDGHPVWSRDYKRVCFQAAHKGSRQLYIADLSNIHS